MAQQELLPICHGFLTLRNQSHLLQQGQGLAPAASAAPAEEDTLKNNGNIHFPPVYLQSVGSLEQSLPCPEAPESELLLQPSRARSECPGQQGQSLLLLQGSGVRT